jgi:magnesium transporter
MIKIYHKTIKDNELNTLDSFKVGSWIYVEDPSEEELESLSKNFSLDLGLLKDAIDPYEVPRLEIDNDKCYVFARAPHQRGKMVSTAPFMIAVGENFVITVSKEPLPFFKKFIDSQIAFTTTQKTKFFLQIFSEITAAYNHQLTNISRNVRSVGVQLENIDNKEIVQFIAFESILNDFLAALIPANAVLNNLLSGSSAGKTLELYEEDKELIEDLFLGNNQLIGLCKANLKTITNIRETCATIMTNNLNRVIKLLTALTIIITVPTIIINFYSMNVALPFAHSPLAFWFIITVTLTMALVLLGIFIKKKWL